MRISNIARWTADFTPPVEAYDLPKIWDYVYGDTVIYNNRLYSCIVENNDASFTPANWKLVQNSYILPYEAGNYYNVNDVVYIHGVLYTCTSAHSAPAEFADDVANWSAISSSSISVNDWKASTAYDVNDIVLVDKTLYRCKVANTSSTAFATDIADWELVDATTQEWVASAYYPVGAVVITNNKLYKCVKANSDSTFDKDNWSAISSGLDVWSASTAYRVNDCVIYDYNIYQCLTAHTSGTTFDSTNWHILSSHATTAFVSGNTYAVGDMCYVAGTSSNVLYIITTAGVITTLDSTNSVAIADYTIATDSDINALFARS